MHYSGRSSAHNSATFHLVLCSLSVQSNVCYTLVIDEVFGQNTCSWKTAIGTYGETLSKTEKEVAFSEAKDGV